MKSNLKVDMQIDAMQHSGRNEANKRLRMIKRNFSSSEEVS